MGFPVLICIDLQNPIAQSAGQLQYRNVWCFLRKYQNTKTHWELAGILRLSRNVEIKYNAVRYTRGWCRRVHWWLARRRKINDKRSYLFNQLVNHALARELLGKKSNLLMTHSAKNRNASRTFESVELPYGTNCFIDRFGCNHFNVQAYLQDLQLNSVNDWHLWLALDMKYFLYDSRIIAPWNFILFSLMLSICRSVLYSLYPQGNLR